MKSRLALSFLLICLAICCALPRPAVAQSTPDMKAADSIAKLLWTVKRVGIVNDFDNLFSADERKRLQQRINDFTKTNGYDFTIVTLKEEPGVKGNLDSLGTIIGRSWGIGSKKFEDGVTIVICAGCREMRVSNGLGTAQILSDPQVLDIVKGSFFPPFKRGAYFEGVDAGLQRLMDELKGKRPPPSF